MRIVSIVIVVAALTGCSRHPFERFFASGQRYLAAKKYSEASIEFQNAVRVDPQSIVAAFHEQVVVHVGDDLPSSAYLAVLADVPELEPPTRKLAGPEAAEAESPALMASAMEFLLEGLHLTKRLNKDASGARALYRGRK